MENKDEEKIDQIINEDNSSSKKNGPLNLKVFIIGLPLFIIQVVVIYFITANYLINQIQNNNSAAGNDSTKIGTELVKNVKNVEYGKYLYTAGDIIVNPAGTDGKRLLLASVALDIKNEDQEQELKKRDVVVRDVIISALSSRNLEQLTQNTYRDSLKADIASGIRKMMPDIQLNNVYFSKFIIQ